MSEVDGFLSDEAASVIPKIRAEFANSFEVVVALNRLAMRAWGQPRAEDVERSEQLGCAGSLFLKALHSVQTIVLLSERGLTAEARVVLRSAAETAIFLLALSVDASVTTKLIDRAAVYRRKEVNGVLTEAAAKTEIGAQRVAEFELELAAIDAAYPDAKKGDPISVWNAAAKTAEGKAIYKAIFAGASNDSTHVNSPLVTEILPAASRGEYRVDAASQREGSTSYALAIILSVARCPGCISNTYEKHRLQWRAQ